MSLTKYKYDERIQNLSKSIIENDRKNLDSFKKEKLENYKNKDVLEMTKDTKVRYINSNKQNIEYYKKL